MSAANVVEFGLTKDMLDQNAAVRRLIIAGQVRGWVGSVLMADGTEVPYAAGVFAAESDKDAMMKAALRHSISRMKVEDPPLKVR